MGTIATRTEKSTIVKKNDPRLLRDALRRLMVAHGALKKAERPCGTPLSIPTAYALLELLEHDGELTVSALAERLAIDRTNVSRMCARLQASGELTLVPHHEDGRARCIRLTARGKSLARQVDGASAKHFKRVSGVLEGPVQQVVDALEQLEHAILKAEGLQ